MSQILESKLTALEVSMPFSTRPYKCMEPLYKILKKFTSIKRYPNSPLLPLKKNLPKEMASAIALRRATASALFSKLINPLRSASVPRSFNTETQVTNFGSDDLGTVDADRRSSDRVLSRRRDTSPSFFPLDAVDPFSPTRTLSQVFNMMDQLMDFPVVGSPRSGGGGVGARRGWDVKEDEKEVYIRMDMPGLSKEDVKLWVEQNTLIIQGEGGKENEEEESGRRYSSRLELPSDMYKVEEIKAEMKNGVLKVVVPKVKEEERGGVREVKVD